MALLLVFVVTVAAVVGSKSAMFELDSKFKTFFDGVFVRTANEDIMMLEDLEMPSRVDSLGKDVMYGLTMNITTDSRGHDDHLENYVSDLMTAHGLRQQLIFLPMSDGIIGGMMGGLHLGSLLKPKNMLQNITAQTACDGHQAQLALPYTFKPEPNEGFGVRIPLVAHGPSTPLGFLSRKTVRQMARRKERRRKRRRERRAVQHQWNNTWNQELDATLGPPTFGLHLARGWSPIGSMDGDAVSWLPLWMGVELQGSPGIRPTSSLTQSGSGEEKQDSVLTGSADWERRRQFDMLEARTLKARRRKNRGEGKTGRKKEKGKKGKGEGRTTKEMNESVQTEVVVRLSPQH